MFGNADEITLEAYSGQLDLTGEVMKMLEEGREDLPVARRGFWADCVDAVLGEVGVED